MIRGETLANLQQRCIRMALFDHNSMSKKPPTLFINSYDGLKHFCVFALLIFGIACFGKLASADTIQHRWAGDVPIMNGLSIEPELGFAFDSPDGRIVMIFASSTVPASKIFEFYGTTLTQLGWGGGNGSWIRGDEKLVIGAVQTARGPFMANYATAKLISSEHLLTGIVPKNAMMLDDGKSA